MRARLLRLIRWPGAVTAAANALTGFLVAHASSGQGQGLAAAGAALGGAIVYAGGVVLNDVADAERDRALHPSRPIPAGLVTREQARRFGLTLLVAGALVTMLTAGLWAGAACALAALFAFTYDFAAKSVRLLGALTLGCARAANALAGVLAGAGALTIPDETRRSLALLYVGAVLAYTVVLTWVSTFEERTPSRLAAGTFATLLFVAAASPWIVFVADWRLGPALAYLPLVLTLIVAARDAAEPDGPGLGALVRAGVFGFLLVDSAWLFGVRRYDTGFALLLGYVALRLVLARSRS